MTFWAIFVGCGLFLLGFAAHFVWWRLSRPADDIRALGLCFLVAPAILAGLFLLLAPHQISPRETIASILVTVAIGAIYIMYYPAAQAASPSMLLILQIVRSAPAGATRQSLAEAFDNELLCRQSISNLVHEHFAEERDGKLVVAPRGSVLLHMLNSWRNFLGLKYGSG